jgi:polyhydroxyalkanoate synthase
MLEGLLPRSVRSSRHRRARGQHPGFCIGGIHGRRAARLAAKGDQRIAGDVPRVAVRLQEPASSVFIDEEQLARSKAHEEKGYLEGTAMATTFNMLRANDLIWSFVVNNYLLGKDPFPFDLLYWNSDSTRMPRCFYLRNIPGE